MNEDKTCQHATELLSGYLDDELSQQHSQLVAVHLAQCPDCNRTYQELEQLQSSIQHAHYPGLEEQAIQRLLNDNTSTTVQAVSWFAIAAGLSMIIVFAVYQFWMDSIMPWYEKMTLSLIWSGGIGLFLTVLRQRLLARKTD